MNQPTKDLFDDSTMTFGEHLEILRVHLIKAIIGLVIAVLICLMYGSKIVGFIRKPIDDALVKYTEVETTDDMNEESVKKIQNKLWKDWGLDTLTELFTGPSAEELAEKQQRTDNIHAGNVIVQVSVEELATALHQALPERFPEPPPAPAESTSTAPDNPAEAAPREDAESETPVTQTISLTLHAPEFAQFQATVEQSRRAVTLTVQEAFLTYIKVSLIAGVILSSPWLFYQAWQFVAAGLYPHERKYVYVYGTLSLGLFAVGAVFCFYAVFPFVLKFLLSFNLALEINPQIRLSEWISFAVMLPLMFGLSFQLPLVMLFLERINIFNDDVYREKRRIAILVIAIISMLLTPADPMSMLLMMFPLIFLYELGIMLCKYSPNTASPFEGSPA